MRTITHTLTAAVLLVLLVGCGGSSVDLPEDVLTDEAYAVVWTDFKAINPDEGVKMLGGMADKMPDEQPKARLWLSAEADDIDGRYRERWDAFTDAGCQGMLTVYYRNENTEGEGDDKRTVVNYRKHTFIKAKKSAKSEDIEKALDQFAEDDGNADFELESVGEDTGWYWVTQDDAPEGSPSMPEDGDAEAVKAFKKLLAKGEGAPVIAAWRMIDGIGEEIDEELDREGLSDERKDELKRAKATQSVVLTCTPGNSAKVSAVVTFDEKDQAKAYAQEHNDKQIEERAQAKRSMMNAENPPHPDVLDDLTDGLKAKVSGKTVSVQVNKGTLKDMLNIAAARSASGNDLTSPSRLLVFESMLKVPSSGDVPGVRSCYDTDKHLSFGRTKLPQ